MHIPTYRALLGRFVLVPVFEIPGQGHSEGQRGLRVVTWVYARNITVMPITSKRASALHQYSQTELVTFQRNCERLGLGLQLNIP